MPVIIIHLNYYFAGSHIVYEINTDDFLIIEKSKKIKYSIKEVNEIVIYMTPNKLRNSAVRSFPFENYYSIKLKLINNETFVITCLHSNKIDKIIEDNFKEIKIIKIRSIFPLIKYLK